MTAEKVTETEFRALLVLPTLATPAGNKQFYTMSSEPNAVKPWFCVDRTEEPEKKAAVASEEEALVWFSANSGPVATETPVEPLPIVPAPAEAASTPQAAPVSQSDSITTDPDRPFQALTDAELVAAIREHEAVYHAVARDAQVNGEKLTGLQASFDKANEDLIAAVKKLKNDAEAAKDSLKLVAREYAYRNPEDKKFDTFVSFKEFTDIEFDQVQMLEWARVNYPLAIIPAVGEQLDVKQTLVVVKSLKDNNKPVPPFVTFKPRTEVQVSTKLPEAVDTSPVSSAAVVSGEVAVGAFMQESPTAPLPSGQVAVDPTTLPEDHPLYSPF